MRDAAGERIVLVAGHGPVALPSFDFEDRHTAETTHINETARERFGLDVTVLRCLHDSDDNRRPVRVYEMEYHGINAQRAHDLQWFTRAAIAHLSWRFAEDRASIEEWFSRGQSTAHEEWQSPGWWQDAAKWIGDRVATDGAGRILRLTQLRAWDSSCVIQVHTEGGEYFFKAMPANTRERAVVVFLASRIGGGVPQVVAHDPNRQWMLMRRSAGDSLEQHQNLERWAAGVAAYAAIQVRCVSLTADLARCGCLTLDMHRLEEEIERLIADTAAMLPDEPDGLSASQIEYLRKQVPTLKHGCRRLAASGVPFTIDHGDLWPGNILANETGCTIIDWEDVRIAHPFLSIAPLIAGMDTYQPTMNLRGALDRFRDIYSGAFSEWTGSQQMRETFAIAEPIGMMDMAIRYWRQPQATVAVNPWMRGSVPYFASLAYRKLQADSGWPD